jgi:hypothetical protein
MQYTIRNVPEYLDAALRNAAREQGKSLNEVTVQALVRGAGLSAASIPKRDLSDFVGTWQGDPSLESALAEQDTIDEEMWPAHLSARKLSRKKAAASIPARHKRARKRAAA